MRIEFKKVNKYYGDLHVLKDLDLIIETGEKVRDDWAQRLWQVHAAVLHQRS